MVAYQAVYPPSMTISLPVMKHDSSEASKRTAKATLSGSPYFFKGMRDSKILSISPSSEASSIGVIMGPGCTELTRMRSSV